MPKLNINYAIKNHFFEIFTAINFQIQCIKYYLIIQAEKSCFHKSHFINFEVFDWPEVHANTLE